MKLQYLGTAAAEGIPALFCHCDTCARARRLGGKNIRTRSQALVDNRLLLDFGADTLLHMLKYDLDLGNIASVFITHAHEDHIYPMDILNRRADFAYLRPGTPPLTVYGSEEIGRLFDVKEDGSILPAGRAYFHEVRAFEPLTVEGYTVTPLKAWHGTQMPLIYAIQKDGKVMLYAHDTDVFPEETWAYLKASGIRFDLVSLDCTAGKERIEYHGHMNLPRLLETRQRLLDMGAADSCTRMIANHFSHNGCLTYDDLCAMELPEGLISSYDGMVVDF